MGKKKKKKIVKDNITDSFSSVDESIKCTFKIQILRADI